MFAPSPFPADGFGRGTAGVLRPLGIGGRMGLTLDPGRLSEDGDVAAASWSGVWSDDRWSEIQIVYLIIIFRIHYSPLQYILEWDTVNEWF